MELKDFLGKKDPCYLIRHWNKHSDDPMFKTEQGREISLAIQKYVNKYKEIKA